MEAPEPDQDEPVTPEEAGSTGEVSADQLSLVDDGNGTKDDGDAQRDPASQHDDLRFQEILDPIHQFISLSEREIKVIDHPAFQRLFRMQQLGQTSFVYRGATHTRGLHSLGTLYTVTLLMDAIDSRADTAPPHRDGWRLGKPLTGEERAFTRLAALLHDVGHIALGHTLEDELGLLDKHDADKRLNTVMDEDHWGGRDITETGAFGGKTLRMLLNDQYKGHAERIQLSHKGKELTTASEILLHLVSKDHLGSDPSEYESQHEQGFRIGVVRDLVGNTLCADLLDYIHRDWQYIGKPRHFEHRILHYTEVREKKNSGKTTEATVVVNLSSDKRGRYRSDAVTAIVDLLESRYQLWEIALLHRTKTAAAAMVERALGEMISEFGYFDRSSPDALAQLPPIRTDISDALVKCLLEATDFDIYRILGVDIEKSPLAELKEFERSEPSIDLLWRLSQRNLYKQVTTITIQDTGSAGATKRVSQIYAPSSESLNGRAVGSETRYAAARNRLETLRVRHGLTRVV